MIRTRFLYPLFACVLLQALPVLPSYSKGGVEGGIDSQEPENEYQRQLQEYYRKSQERLNNNSSLSGQERQMYQQMMDQMYGQAFNTEYPPAQQQQILKDLAYLDRVGERMSNMPAWRQEALRRRMESGWIPPRMRREIDQMVQAVTRLNKNGVLSDQAYQTMVSKMGGGSQSGGNIPGKPPPSAWRGAQGIVGQNPDLQNGLAQSYLDYGNPMQAMIEAEKAMAMDPMNPGNYVIYGQAAEKLGEYGTAHEAAKKALELDPRNFEAKALASLTAGRAGPTDARPPDVNPMGTEFFKTPKVDPLRSPNPVAAVGAGNLVKKAYAMLKQGDAGGAYRAAQRLLRENPKDLDARFISIQALIKSHRLREALREADLALKFAPGNSKFLTVRSKVHNMMKNYKLGLQDADSAIQSDPSNAEAYLMRGWSMDGLGLGKEQVLSSLEQACMLDARFCRVHQMAKAFDDGELALFMQAAALGQRYKKEDGLQDDEKGDARSWWMLGLATLVGGLMIALGLGGLASKKWKNTIVRWLGGARDRSPELERMPDVAAAGGDGRRSGTIAGAYQIVRQIGLGGMGIVYEAVDTGLDRHVAVKKMREEIRADPRERERFLKEARMVAAMHHPNIVDIYSIVEDGNDAFLIFEFVAGQTLTDVLHARKKLSYPEALGVAGGVVAALEYAHKRGVIHRDLKPSNIMLSKEREVKVMDFGVARQAKDSMSRMSMTNTVVGTPPYMAPEQEQGVVRRESDVYALAICIYEMVTGEMPFAGIGAGMLIAKMNKTYVPASRKNSELPQGFDSVMDKALDPDPDKRYGSAAELFQAFKSLLARR